MTPTGNYGSASDNVVHKIERTISGFAPAAVMQRRNRLKKQNTVPKHSTMTMLPPRHESSPQQSVHIESFPVEMVANDNSVLCKTPPQRKKPVSDNISIKPELTVSIPDPSSTSSSNMAAPVYNLTSTASRNEQYIPFNAYDDTVTREANRTMQNSKPVKNNGFAFSIGNCNRNNRIYDEPETIVGNSSTRQQLLTAMPPSSARETVVAQTKEARVEKWLVEQCPYLHPDDLGQYAKTLTDMGFDSKVLLETELRAGDLDFMKVAHKRALMSSLGFL